MSHFHFHVAILDTGTIKTCNPASYTPLACPSSPNLKEAAAGYLGAHWLVMPCSALRVLAPGTHSRMIASLLYMHPVLKRLCQHCIPPSQLGQQ